jgi:hypothetical protein
MANITDRNHVQLNSVSDNKTEMAFVVGGIFIATLLAPIFFLAWSLISALYN